MAALFTSIALMGRGSIPRPLPSWELTKTHQEKKGNSSSQTCFRYFFLMFVGSLYHTADGSEIPNNHLGCIYKILVNNGDIYHINWLAGISEPSTVSLAEWAAPFPQLATPWGRRFCGTQVSLSRWIKREALVNGKLLNIYFLWPHHPYTLVNLYL